MNIHHNLKSGAITASLLFLHLISCAGDPVLKSGTWRAVLQLNDSTELPFNFEVKQDEKKVYLEIINADEKIRVDEISNSNGSFIIKLPVFDSYFTCELKSNGDSLTGNWINNARKEKNSIPFRAGHNDTRRFTVVPGKALSLKERYKVTFSPGKQDEYHAIGLFAIENGICKGTFTTESGDYRYLEGYSSFGKFMVSCFDGSHAFLFTAEKKGDSLVNGHFYSGIHHFENFQAVMNNTFELRDPDSLTFLKKGESPYLSFSYKNLEGKTVSLSDERYKGKVVIIQLMGTWCPNCMDETAFLAQLYKDQKKDGLEIIGLAFERTDDFNKAAANVKRTAVKFDAQYEFLITMKTGSSQASEVFPMLNKISAFPTTIYIDKKGMIRKVYTGYYGPATGSYHTDYVKETRNYIEKLLKE
jgi:thiol-disulfide isomerase/thioredoxin